MNNLFFVISIFSTITGCTSTAADQDLQQEIDDKKQKFRDTISITYSGTALANYYYSEKIGGRNFTLQDSQKVRIRTTDPIFFIEASAKQIPYVLVPGDSVSITNSNGITEVTLLDSLRQNEILFFKYLVDSTGPIINLFSNFYTKAQVTTKERDRLIQEKYHQRIRFLNAYQKKFSMRSGIVSYYQQVLQGAKLNEQLAMYYPGFNKRDLINYYRDSFSTFRTVLNDPDLLKHTIFRQAIINFSRFYAHTLSTKAWMFFDGLKTEELLVIWDSASKYFDGEAKSFIQAQLIKALSFDKYSYQNLKALAKKIIGKEYRMSSLQMLNSKYAAPDNKDVFEQMLYGIDGNLVNFKSILPADTIVVIDFWASWCVPCINEFKYTKFIEEKLHNAPVKFIRFSTDENQDAWREAAQRYKIQTNSFRIKEANSKIITEWKVSSIPRFIIIKNLKVLDTDASRPSDGNKLLQRLSSMMK